MTVPPDAASLAAQIKGAADAFLTNQDHGLNETTDDVGVLGLDVAKAFREHGWLEELEMAVAHERTFDLVPTEGRVEAAKGRAINLVHRHLGRGTNDVRQTSVWTLRFERATTTVQIVIDVDSYPAQCRLEVSVLDRDVGTWRREALVWMSSDELRVFKIASFGPARDAALQAVRGEGLTNPLEVLKLRALADDEGEAMSRAVEILETQYGTLDV